MRTVITKTCIFALPSGAEIRIIDCPPEDEDYLKGIAHARAELAAEREKVKELTERLTAARDLRMSQAKVNGGMSEQLAAAQATVAQMREAFEGLFAHCLSNGVYNAWGEPLDCTKLNKAFSMSPNQDALHEALAREIEKFAERVRSDIEGVAGEFAMRQIWRTQEREAAAHRARKEAK